MEAKFQFISILYHQWPRTIVLWIWLVPHTLNEWDEFFWYIVQCHRIASSTESNPILIPRKAEIVSLQNIYPCYKNFCKVKTCPRKENRRRSHTYTLSRIPYKRWRIMLMNSLDAILIKLIPLWFSHESLSPFLCTQCNHRFIPFTRNLSRCPDCS